MSNDFLAFNEYADVLKAKCFPLVGGVAYWLELAIRRLKNLSSCFSQMLEIFEVQEAART